MKETSRDIAQRLAERALLVCRHYLPNGKRMGDYWLVGDKTGAKGRSLYVRLSGPRSGKGAAGKWTDAASGEYGDLLDIIAGACRLTDHRDVLDEARRFIGALGQSVHRTTSPRVIDTARAARNLFAASKPVRHTLAAAYLKSRGVDDVADLAALRFHPRCHYRHDSQSPVERWPALIAAVTNPAGEITGAHRTFLARDGSEKAPLPFPRKAMGALSGNGVRFGVASDVVAAGEGVETVLSVRALCPSLPTIAALSAQHLRALALPSSLRRLYVLADRDEAGLAAASELCARAAAQRVETFIVTPLLKDFNDDLQRLGRDAMRETLRPQLTAEDRERLLARRRLTQAVATQ
jgi:phage/plasmid primase-like uncharacterized protein